MKTAPFCSIPTLSRGKRLAAQRAAKAAEQQRKNARNVALATAAAMNDVPAMRKLLEQGAEVNARTSSGVTPLIWVCSASSGNIAEIVEAAKLLISKDCDANAQTDAGKTALYYAVKTKRILGANEFRQAIVKVLLDAHANPNLGPPGESPLCCELALSDVDPVIVEELVAAGADVKPNCNGTGNPLDVALRSNGVVARILRQAGARSMNDH